MQMAGGLRIDPVVLDIGATGEGIELVVLYTEWSLASGILKKLESLTAGLNPTVRLVAVHTVPYPLPFGCQASVHAHLVEQLVDLASNCGLAVDAQVVLARYQEEGFRHVLNPESIVVIGARKQLWRSREERLAHNLAREGYRVALLHIK